MTLLQLNTIFSTGVASPPQKAGLTETPFSAIALRASTITSLIASLEIQNDASAAALS